MEDEKKHPFGVMQVYVNSFRHLLQDADLVYYLAKQDGTEDGEKRNRLCRTAVLLYILSLEGLINRVLHHFTPERLRDFLLEREASLSFLDKWELIPLLFSEGDDHKFDKGAYPGLT